MSARCKFLMVYIQSHPCPLPVCEKCIVEGLEEAVQQTNDPVEAWKIISENPDLQKTYKSARGKGGFVRGNWDEVNMMIASQLMYTIKTYGPDRIIGFSPIPAMSMVSYAGGARF